MANKEKTVYFCSECGYESVKWSGRCPGCGSWNAMVESTSVTGKKKTREEPVTIRKVKSIALSEVNSEEEVRISTGISEMDRVLGGGAVLGSLILVGGEPGIGKSTLLLQICKHFVENKRVLYVSGEESLKQLKLRADRIGITGNGPHVLAETDLDRILQESENISPDILVVDSIQTVFNPDSNSAPGSVSQIKECTMSLMRYAKTNGVTVFIVGHVNKDGALAGPKVLEHMVDCVLSFEGDRSFSHRVLHADKNRFGSTSEIGVFEMAGDGLREVKNPSEMLLSGRPVGVPGGCVTCVMEGSRPVLAEIQALVAPTAYGNPRRMSSGVDFNRTALLLAVLERRAGLIVSNKDVYINVVGGLRIDDTAVDLSVVLALASCLLDRPLAENIVAFGEIGLSGELRSVSSAEQRLSEILRLGFTRCVMPYSGTRGLQTPSGLEIIRVKSVREAIEAVV